PAAALQPDLVHHVLVPTGEHAHAVGAAGDLVEMLQHVLPRHVVDHVLGHFVGGLDAQPHPGEHTQGTQVHGSAGQARIVGVDGDQFTAGVDELEADHVTGQAPYAVPRTVRSGTDRPTHRNMGQGGHRFQRPAVVVQLLGEFPV